LGLLGSSRYNSFFKAGTAGVVVMEMHINHPDAPPAITEIGSYANRRGRGIYAAGTGQKNPLLR
jgi:hypothetical protein